MGRGLAPHGGGGAEQAGGQDSPPASPQTHVSLTQRRCQGVTGVEGSFSLQDPRRLGTDGPGLQAQERQSSGSPGSRAQAQ